MTRTNVSVIEKGGATFHGIKLLLSENPLPPIDAAISAAHAKVPGMTGYAFARKLAEREILLKPLHQPGLGDHYVRFTTSTPENNARALEAIRQILD